MPQFGSSELFGAYEREKKKSRGGGDPGLAAGRRVPGVAWSSRMTAPSRKQAFCFSNCSAAEALVTMRTTTG